MLTRGADGTCNRRVMMRAYAVMSGMMMRTLVVAWVQLLTMQPRGVRLNLMHLDLTTACTYVLALLRPFVPSLCLCIRVP